MSYLSEKPRKVSGPAKADKVAGAREPGNETETPEFCSSMFVIPKRPHGSLGVKQEKKSPKPVQKDHTLCLRFLKFGVALEQCSYGISPTTQSISCFLMFFSLSPLPVSFPQIPLVALVDFGNGCDRPVTEASKSRRKAPPPPPSPPPAKRNVLEVPEEKEHKPANQCK